MSLWLWIKSAFGKSKRTKSNTFEGLPIDLVMGIDFELLDWTNPKDKSNWATIRILKGKYTGVRYKYNSLKLNTDTESENFMLSMDYDFLETAGFDIPTLGKDAEFNNLVFNVAHTLIITELSKDVEVHTDGNTGRNDSGELDRE